MFGGDGRVQNLDYGDGFMGSYICHNFGSYVVYYVLAIPL